MKPAQETSADEEVTPRLQFQKHQHLRRPAEFEAVYEQKRQAGDGHLLVFAAANGLGWTRIGLSVSRRHGGSVQRQRLKRLLREAFRLTQHQLPPGLDLVLIPRPNNHATVLDFQRSLVSIVNRLDRRLTKEQQQAGASADARRAPTTNEEPQS